jgi:glyceraldehyde-3-phosphate dehydrogenase/erythrose-4-phosphate dehydrogenase
VRLTSSRMAHPEVSAERLGIGGQRASIAGIGVTLVVGGDPVKVIGWHDSEWGYASQMVREALRLVGEA